MPLSCQNLSTEVKRGSVVSFPIQKRREKKLRHQTENQELFFFSFGSCDIDNKERADNSDGKRRN